MGLTSGGWIKVFLVIASAAAFFYFVSVLSDIARILIISALLAYIMDPLAVKIESRGMSRASATVIIFAGIAVLLVCAMTALLPALIDQVSAIQSDFSPEKAREVFQGLDRFFESRLAFMGVHDLQLSEKFQKAMLNSADWIISHLADAVGLVTHMVLIPFITFFLLKDGRDMKKQLVSVVPNRYFEFSLNLLSKMDSQLGNFLRGQFLDALIVGAMSVCALWVLDIKYFLLIGVFAGSANLIPFVGPVAGAALAVIVSLVNTGSLASAGYIILAFVIIKLLDDSLIQPVIVARSVDMHPLMVILAVIIGGRFFGVLGMLLSVPATGFIKIAVKESLLLFRRYRMA